MTEINSPHNKNHNLKLTEYIYLIPYRMHLFGLYDVSRYFFYSFIFFGMHAVAV